MNHSFDIDLATKYGVNCAILFENIAHWIAKNRANEKHFYDGRYWTYNSVKAFSELFPYMSEKQIRYALDKLEKVGLIMTGNYNETTYDRTKWYALTDMGESTLRNCQIELPTVANPFVPFGKCVGTSSNESNTTDNKPDINQKEEERKNPLKGVRKKAEESVPIEAAHPHGEYGWVKLTDTQYARLVKDMGKQEADRCIDYVDTSAQSNSNKNKWTDWNLVVRRCHRENWGHRNNSYSPPEPQKVTPPPDARSYQREPTEAEMRKLRKEMGYE